MQDDKSETLKDHPEVLAYRFMQHCLREKSDFDRARRISLHPNFEWQTLLAVASIERLSPLLFHTLDGRNIAPANVEQALEDANSYMARRNLLLLHELSGVLNSLGEIGIDVVVLKGAALAETVYDTIALRPMGDLDLLIGAERLEEAIQRISSIGYSLDDRTNLAGAVEYENEVQLNKSGIEEIGLDLHWNLFDWHYYINAMPMEWFWQSTRPTLISDVNARILGPEAQLLHLCAHTVIGHGIGVGGLLWLVDIKEAICHYEDEFDWDVILDMAQESSLILPLQRVLPWVAKTLDAPVPKEVLECCQQMQPSAEETRMLKLRSYGSPTMAQRALSDLGSIQGWSKRSRYLYVFVLRKAFAPPRNLTDRYQIRHRLLLPFYYAYWWINGLADLIRLAMLSRRAN